MRKVVLDVENTITVLSDKYSDFSPYNPNNRLVSIGWMVIENNQLSPVKYTFTYHNELSEQSEEWQVANKAALEEFKRDLASAELIIGQNLKYDIQWLRECGFKVDGIPLNDTMIMEYIMARGRKDLSFSLEASCERYKVASKKKDIVQKYLDEGVMFDAIPLAIVDEYGRGDIQSTAELYLAQCERLRQAGYQGLYKTIGMSHEFSGVLSEMERNGVCIDTAALQLVETEFTKEAQSLKADLDILIRHFMGDTPVNLDSPKQLSEVLYSRKIREGKEEDWVKVFNIGKDKRGKFLRRPKMKYVEYAQHVRDLTDVVFKTKMHKCEECDGKGSIYKIKKSGLPWNKPTRCKTCGGAGIVYVPTQEIAGLKLKAPYNGFCTISGFSTNQTFLEEIIGQATDAKAKEFVEKLMKLSSVSSYLSTFVGGIKAFVQQDNHILHTRFNQTITSTGRLSSTQPNLQNMPREGTFPIRKVFKSRWSAIGGEIADVDFSQLEFRCAVDLSRDERGKFDILGGVDVHIQTRDIITAAGQPINRQEAKSHTFKPLYAGQSGTEAEKTYYKAFLQELYTGVGAWHKRLQEEAIARHSITLPTGRQYLFPTVERAWHGGATQATQICNFPVQGYATADIVPISIIRLHKEFKTNNLKSLIVLTVHDSVSVDIYPGEREIVLSLMSKLAEYAMEELKIRYGIDMFVPLACEVKVGANLMEMKKVA